jgi:hypothetical protein
MTYKYIVTQKYIVYTTTRSPYIKRHRNPPHHFFPRARDPDLLEDAIPMN